MTQATASEPRLDYTGDRWQGEDNTLFLWMDDRTFQGYVTAYLEARGITEPTPQDRYDAVQYCRRLFTQLSLIAALLRTKSSLRSNVPFFTETSQCRNSLS